MDVQLNAINFRNRFGVNGTIYSSIVLSLSHNPKVKELLKSVDIFQRYYKKIKKISQFLWLTV